METASSQKNFGEIEDIIKLCARRPEAHEKAANTDRLRCSAHGNTKLFLAVGVGLSICTPITGKRIAIGLDQFAP